MRTMKFLGLAAAMAMAPTIAESAPGGASVPIGKDWSGVPTIPLRPPVEMAPQGNWSSGGGWRGERPNPPGSWGRSRGDHTAFGHFRPRRGLVMPRQFVSPTFFVWNWRGYGLSEPGHGRRWVRYYGDAVLIDDHGHIHDTVPDIDWDDFDGDEAMHRGWRGYHGYPPAFYYVPIGVTTTVVVHGPPMVTTTTRTTTTVVEEKVVRPRSKILRPRRK